jgi:Arc/MetJ-type ribon-helix-helix transcriptional regulator
MTSKIAVSLPDDLVMDARRAVERGQAASVSAYVAEALAMRRRQDTIESVLDALDAEFGPVDADVQDWAVRTLDGSPS